MNKTKLFVITLVVTGILFALSAKSYAETKIGLIDMAQIIQNYDKAKEAQADLQVSQEQIKKMIASARKEVKGIKEKKVKKELEKKLTEEILKKNNVFKQDFAKKWQAVQNNILTTIKKVADKQEYDLIMDKQTVIAGGKDITKEVLKELKK